VSLEKRAVVPRHSFVEVIAEPRFDLFASPDHFRSVLLSLFLYFRVLLVLTLPLPLNMAG
jgi:hypothetical protein